MPGMPTEVLNDDIKGLKTDIHRVEVGLAESRAEFRTAIAVAKWVVTSLVALTAVTATGLLSGVWWASGISGDVRTLQGQVGEIRSEVRIIQEQAGRLDGRVGAIQADIRDMLGQIAEIRALLVKDREPAPTRPVVPPATGKDAQAATTPPAGGTPKP